MKLRQIIIIGSLLGVLGFIFYSVTKNDQRQEQEAKEKKLDTQFFEAIEVQNKPHQFSLVSYGQIEANQSLTLSPQVSGRLLKGAVTLKPGVQFRKGQLLYKIENTEALYNLNSRKSSYINLIGSIMPDISLDFPNEKEKWLKYLNSIRLDENIPGLPQWSSGKEKLFLASKNILSEYFNIKALETNISKYYSFAPFNGTITEKYVEPGATVGMGSQIIKIVKTGDYELKIPVKSQEIELIKTAGLLTLIDASGKNIGSGKILRISNVLNASTQSIDIYLKVIPNEGQVLYNGMYINVSLGSDQETIAVALPKRALDKDQVYMFDTDTSFIQKPVDVIHFFSDSVLVTGLKNGSKVMPSTPDFYNKNAPVQIIIKK